MLTSQTPKAPAIICSHLKAPGPPPHQPTPETNTRIPSTPSGRKLKILRPHNCPSPGRTLGHSFPNPGNTAPYSLSTRWAGPAAKPTQFRTQDHHFQDPPPRSQRESLSSFRLSQAPQTTVSGLGAPPARVLVISETKPPPRSPLHRTLGSTLRSPEGLVPRSLSAAGRGITRSSDRLPHL